MTATDLSMPGGHLYQGLLARASAAGAGLLAQVLGVARQSLREDAQRVRGLQERDQLELSARLMQSHAAGMTERFAVVLAGQFKQTAHSEPATSLLSVQALRLDQLELMDEGQVQERVEMARLLQQVMLRADAALNELNTYVCALLGLSHVSPERNPLRPDSYVAALQQVTGELNIPMGVHTSWLQHMAQPLGDALRASYQEWSAQLRGQRVQPAGYTVVRTVQASGAAAAVPADGEPGGSDRAIWTPQYRQTVLTLDRLRRLMAGELDTAPESARDAFARQFAQQFETHQDSHADASGTDFAATVPAALDALQEMQQVDRVVQRMRQGNAPAPRAGELPAGLLVRQELTQRASAMSQVLSLEVVSLMLDNLVQDVRLLPPIRRIIEQIEPALLRLVFVDPRFFIDREHPARRLLQEISQRGLAFGSMDDPALNGFVLSLQRHVSPLAVMQIDGVEPFEQSLQRLLQEWDDPVQQASIASQIDTAVAALGYAEERNLLAEQMGEQLKQIAGVRKQPQEVLDFLLGPWSQVMAEAQLKEKTGVDDAGGYKALVLDLLWSTQPELTRKDISRLTRLVSKLLNKLREGLGLIAYPSVKTSAFFDVLMKLHQQAFRPATPADDANAKRGGLAESLLVTQEQWVAPSEAKVSGFMAFPDERPSAPAQPVALQPVPDAPAPPESVALHVGCWVEVQIKGAWQRTQLSWISPHGTMYLFTSRQGKTQSMTQRLLDRMRAEGKLRVVSSQASIVDGALTAVVHTAMLNSLDHPA